MWFEYAHGKEKIIHMFNSELSLDDVVFESFIFYTHSSLRVNFYVKKIPQHVPEKWEAVKFNAIKINLEFSNVTKFESKGCNLGFRCTPAIYFNDGNIYLIIKDKDFELSCISEFMEIQDIAPFLGHP
ncbi:Imm50 family immunity protein [Citrobacter sp. OP27]